MKYENKNHKYTYLLPLGILVLLPAFITSFIRKGNSLDRLFFFTALAGFILIVIATVKGYRK